VHILIVIAAAPSFTLVPYTTLFRSYIVLSNRESGNGRPDILLKYPSVRGKAVILEIKVADTFSGLEEKCDEALRQIEEQEYEESLRQEGYQDILKYGVAFYRKECMVKRAVE